MTDEEIDALEDPATWEAIFDARARGALTLTDAMCGPGSHELDSAMIIELRDLFTEEELAELILVIGQANLNNRAGNAAKQLLGEGPSA